MTALIWMLMWLPQVLPAMSKPPPPVNLTMTSSHFVHMLKWEAGPGTPTGVYYKVTMVPNTGSAFLPVAGCERVRHPLVCNLTQAFSDRDQVYLTQVTALLEAHTSDPGSTASYQGFKPIKDTELDLPLLTVTPCGRNLCVDLEPPVEHLRDVYMSLDYKLRIKYKRVETFQNARIQRREVLENLAPGEQYCISVCFSDSLVPRMSNYSRPVCAYTSGSFTADLLISAVLCVLVLLAVAVVVLLARAGFICPIRRPLPRVLTSIRHLEEGLVVMSRCTSVASLLIPQPTLPSSGEKQNKQTSDDSDTESETESAAGGGGGYNLRVGTKLLSSCSSSSSSLSARLSPNTEPPPNVSSNQTSEPVSPLPAALTSAQTQPSGGADAGPSSHSESLPGPAPPAPADPDRSTGGTAEPSEEEREGVGEGSSLDVNLLTLTFGRCEEEEEEKSHAASEAVDTSPVLSTQTQDTQEVDLERVSCSAQDEEDEEDEDSGYMSRPSTQVLRNLL